MNCNAVNLFIYQFAGKIHCIDSCEKVTIIASDYRLTQYTSSSINYSIFYLQISDNLLGGYGF